MEHVDTNYIYPKNKDIDIIIGDKKQKNFKPRMKIERWDNEVNFSVGIISTHTGNDMESSGKVEWNDGHGIKARFYQKPEDEFEFEIELESEPENRIVELSIETKGLDFFYQPFEVEDGCFRPENVKGSYAVYHHEMSGGKYRAGKAFHIYRPHVTDINNKQEWCELDITNNIMRITVPTGLVYPVVIDPTFGCSPSSPGGSEYIMYINYLVGTNYTSYSEDSTGQSITAYVKKPTGAAPTHYFKGVMALTSNKNIISNGVTGSAAVTSGTWSWVTATFTTDPSLPASTEYWIMCITNDTGRLAYDTWAARSLIDTTNTYSSPANPTDGGSGGNIFSVYCTYTEVSNPIPLIIHHLQEQRIL